MFFTRFRYRFSKKRQTIVLFPFEWIESLYSLSGFGSSGIREASGDHAWYLEFGDWYCWFARSSIVLNCGWYWWILFDNGTSSVICWSIEMKFFENLLGNETNVWIDVCFIPHSSNANTCLFLIEIHIRVKVKFTEVSRMTKLIFLTLIKWNHNNAAEINRVYHQ